VVPSPKTCATEVIGLFDGGRLTVEDRIKGWILRLSMLSIAQA